MSGFGRKLFVAAVMHCGRRTLLVLSGSVWLRHQGTSRKWPWDLTSFVWVGLVAASGFAFMSAL